MIQNKDTVVVKGDKDSNIILFIWVFFHKHSQSTGQQGKGEAISLTLL